MATFNVTQVIKSPGNDAVQISYGRGISAVRAAANVSDILADVEKGKPDGFPESLDFKTLSIMVEVVED